MTFSSIAGSSASRDDSGRPSGVRHWVVALATAMAVFLYLDRICLSFMERYIREDIGLSNDQASILLSAFFWTYALGQVPSGWLSDRFGARRMLAIYILLWSLFTGAMGWAWSFAALLVYRFGCGLAQAGAYPTSANLLSKWVPFSGRGLASAIVSTGGRIGGFAAPVLTAYLMVAFIPANVSVQFQVDDLLSDAGTRKLPADAPETPADRLARVIGEQLSPPAAAAVRQWAREKTTSSDPAERDLLLNGLNEALGRADLHRSIDRDEFALPAEARKLGEVPDDQVTPQQIKRRNRLLLETAYPDQLRKLYGPGWRPTMIVYGAAGILVALAFWLIVRDRPQDHRLCNRAEIEVIEEGRPPMASSPHGEVRGLPLRHMLRSRSLWLSSISQFGTNFGWVFLITWFPRYLAEVHHVPIVQRGWMSSYPILCGMVGMMFGGWLADALTRAIGLRWGRCLPMALTRFVVMAAFLACRLLEGPWAVTAALCVVAVGVDLGTPAVWAFKQDVGGRHVGSILGWGNMWGNLGAAVSPLVLNAIVTHLGWNAVFQACALAFLVAGVVSLGIDSRIPIVPDPDRAAPVRP